MGFQVPSYGRNKDLKVLQRRGQISFSRTRHMCPKNISRFCTQIEDILLQVWKQGGQQVSSELFNMQADTLLETNFLRGTWKACWTQKISPQEERVRSLGMMDFIGSCSESSAPGMTVTAHYAWKTWLKCLESRFDFATKRTSCSASSNKEHYQDAFLQSWLWTTFKYATNMWRER